MAFKLGSLPLGLGSYIKNPLHLTSPEGGHLMGCGDKQWFVLPLVFCPWLLLSTVPLPSSVDAAELMWAVIALPLRCCDQSAAAAGQYAWHLAGFGNAALKHLWTHA